MKDKSKGVLVSMVFGMVGFLLAISFDLSEALTASRDQDQGSQVDDQLREQLISEEEKTIELSKDMLQVQSELQEVEDEVASRRYNYENMVKKLEELRMLTGAVAVEGEGVTVELKDAEYIPEEENPNSYIVHEQHIQQVIDELRVSGAEAIAVNGRRIDAHSYIRCVGPVIEIDGYTSYAPFEITAIGDNEMFKESLNLPGGVMDQLLNENIEVRINQLDSIVIDSVYDDRR
ncbi:DUF881 domain-containing protein [Texcoconibacillus texcoconensis]|uniref:Uncharacterized protein YlxW (UPF0749 family) n=1 Tax=Texcoconibacillus texcoconensis TaxID=1095777 RepID=A0A840QLC6_9BACI|nr:uncharacterized protein YlxW (UPF0749 family) [Texcoconibacillus texcoconensis]